MTKIFVMFEGQISPLLAEWLLVLNSEGNLMVIDEGREKYLREACESLTLKIALHSQENKSSSVEVFLYIDKEDFLQENFGFLNYRLLAKVLKILRQHSWGANLYTVLEKSFQTKFSEATRVAENYFLIEWFKANLENGVLELIELRGTKKELLQNLQNHSAASKKRRRLLKKFIRQNGWNLLISPGETKLKETIEVFKQENLLLINNDSQNQSVLLANLGGNRNLTSNRFSNLQEIAKKSYDLCSSENDRFAALLPEAELSFAELRTICHPYADHMEIIFFNGMFEWMYTMMRLSQASIIPALKPFNIENHFFETVSLKENRIFPYCSEVETPRLLITNGFNSHKDSYYNFSAEESDYCLAASREIASFTSRLPFHTEIEVCPIISCETLPDILKHKHYTAWIHLSHGRNGAGLSGADGQTFSSQGWLDCFDGFDISLNLALFSSCESSEPAQRFAEAGCQVAIGFSSEVIFDATESLTAMILPVIINHNGKQEAILASFHEACEHLFRKSFIDEGKEKKYIDSLPRAFFAKVE